MCIFFYFGGGGGGRGYVNCESVIILDPIITHIILCLKHDEIIVEHHVAPSILKVELQFPPKGWSPPTSFHGSSTHRSTDQNN
jgi:hypothetical protein